MVCSYFGFIKIYKHSFRVTLEQNVSNFKEQNQTETVIFEEAYAKRTNSLNLYIGVVITSTILTIVRSLAFFNFIKLGCIRMHKHVVSSILNSKMNFFDNNLIGNVLNRFSRDYLVVDEYFPFNLGECLMVQLHFFSIHKPTLMLLFR